jgi:hypothetical protein
LTRSVVVIFAIAVVLLTADSAESRQRPKAVARTGGPARECGDRTQGLEQLAAFSKERNAERFVWELKRRRTAGLICRAKTESRGTVYRVFAKQTRRANTQAVTSKGRDTEARKGTYLEEGIVHTVAFLVADQSAGRRSSGSMMPVAAAAASSDEEAADIPESAEPAAEAVALKDSVPDDAVSQTEKASAGLDARPAVEAGQGSMEGDVPQTDEQIVLPAGADVPVELSQTGEGSSEGFFKRVARYLHPAITVTEVYTDNAFSTKRDKKSDFSTYVIPNFTLAFPLLSVSMDPSQTQNTTPRSPSGLLVSTLTPEVLRRLQLFASYEPIIPVVSKNSPSGNMIGHKLDGTAAYNMRSGISLSANDSFVRSYDTRSAKTTTGDEVDKYRSNLLNAIASYDTGNRLRLRLDYSNFMLNYDAASTGFRDRRDNAYTAYLYFRVQPRTSLFAQYTFIDIDHIRDPLLDSEEQNMFGGVEWDITAKSKGVLKAGYGIKDFEAMNERPRNFICEAQLYHRFTSKTSAILKAFRKTNETDIETALYMVSNGVTLDYQQRITSKVTGAMNFLYEDDDYKGGVDDGRNDKIYQAGIRFQYAFRRWLRTDFGYTFTERRSNRSEFDFSSNTVSVGLTGSL